MYAERQVRPSAVARSRPRPSKATALALGLSMIVAGLLPTALRQPPPAAAATDTLASTTALPTAQINGVVWNQIVVGNWVYAGGSFSKARPAGAAAGTSEVTRSNLMAYTVNTGVMGNFNPVLNGEVKNLALSPDKKTLYVVGTFTKVGTAVRNRIAAFDVKSGKLTSFAPTLNSTVLGIIATSKGIFVSGSFSSANGVTRSKTAAFSTSGALLRWAPTIEGGDVRDLLMNPTNDRIVLGGNFTKVDGSTRGMGLALVGTDRGNVLYTMAVNNTVRNGASVSSGIYDLAGDSSGFYATGWGNAPTLEGAVKVDWKGGISWIEDCHGDTYSIWPMGTYVYTASHAHYCANVQGFGEPVPERNYRGMAFTSTAKGILSPDPTHYKDWAGQPRPRESQFYPDINAGTYTKLNQGAWSVTGTGNYVFYAGEFTTVNGKPQQGLVRFANRIAAKATDGPQLPSGYAPVVKRYAGGLVRVRWASVPDRDTQFLTYDLLKNGKVVTPAKQTGPGYFWIQPSMGYLDSGLTTTPVTYQVRVTDGDGNTALSKQISYTYSSDGAALSNYNTAVLTDNPDAYWTGSADPNSGKAVVTNLAVGDDVPVVGNADGTKATATDSTNNHLTTSPGALGGSTRSFAFTGSQTISTPTQDLAPNTFSVEAWFRSASTTGGAIATSSTVQAGSTPLKNSVGDDTRADRAVYLDPQGRVNFGLWARKGYVDTSPKSYNDGQWHHVVATMDYTGTKLFVDGTLVHSQSAIFGGTNKMAYWRVGGDLLTGYPTNPTTNPNTSAPIGYLTGDVDQVAIYQRALSASRVQAHYQAR